MTSVDATPSYPGRPRRTPAVVAAGLLLLGSLGVATLVPAESAASVCGPDAEVVDLGRGPVACVHEDVAPRGVDVTEHVPTAELREREGGGERAYEAAEELGVAATTVASGASSPAVPCDGDGASGYRLQAMYVVEAGRTNRFAALEASLKLWAAGADDVVNRSAALTGGVRNLRYVTEPGANGTCEADVLNVTVPAGAMSSFNSTISAVQALGYTDARRKYVMWTDANVLCGVATMYPYDDPSQGNPNNGSYAQYARIDTGCWGFGDGAGQHSVEAHEIAHTLGGVQNSAPHSTKAGHCWDERDTMCYADGGTHAMVQVCPPEREYLLDCNTDDYFSTFPDPGSYLDTHWNAADSRFLIGGGDGSGGGTAGTPTVLGATIGINNPAVPGLATQVTVTPTLPEGRTVTSVLWRSARTDCTFSDPTALQSEVTCSAAATGTTSVTVTVKDSTGATKTLTGPLTFQTGTARPVQLDLGVASQATSTASVCTAAAFPVQVQVTDTATGQPVKGLVVSFTKKTSTMTLAGSAGAAYSQATGTATVNGTATVPTTYSGKTLATKVYAASTAGQVTAQPGKCAPALTAAADRDEVYYGDPVTLTGTLTRTVGGVEIPVSGALLPVKLTYLVGTSTRVAALGSAKTAADGSWRIAVKPTSSGSLSVSLASSTGYTGTTVSLGDVTVRQPTSALTAAADRTEVAYGEPLVLTGRMTKTAGDVTSGVGGATVYAKLTPAGKAPLTVGTGRTLADGTYTVKVPLRYSGQLVVTYAGSAAVPTATAPVGPVVAATWSTAITLRSTKVVSTTLTYQLNGTLTRTYGGATSPAKSLRVKVYFTPTSTGTPVLVGTPTTTTTGAFALRVYPKAAGSYTAVLSATTGYADATSAAVPVTLG